MDPVNEVHTAFTNLLWKGEKIPVIQWTENYVFQGETMFMLTENSDAFPAFVNGKRGRGSGGKVWRQSDITINAKYYESVAITRFQKYVDGRPMFLFHAKVYKPKQSAGQSAVKKLKREMETSPNEYVLPQPTFSLIDPTNFSIVRGKRETIRVTGERLKASSGRLERIGGNDQIVLFISNAVNRTQITAEFSQPEALTTSSYVMYLVVYDHVYKFDNPQHTINFTDQLDQVAKALFSTIGYMDPLQDPSMDFFLSQNTLTQAIELGNTRGVATLSQKYDDGYLPKLIDEGKKGERTEALLNQPVALARKSGNICTLLFVIVWNEVSKGRRELIVLNKLRDFVKQSKNLTAAGMLLAIREENDNNNEFMAIENKIRASLAKPELATVVVTKKLVSTVTPKGNQKTDIPTNPYNKTFQCKLVLLGESAAGKSSLVLRFVRGQFMEYHETTIGAAFLTQTVSLKDATVKFEIWDTAGQERYHSLAPMYYRGAQAAIVVYDITNYDSFERAKKWVKELQRQGGPSVVIALAGNKADLASKRAVDTDESLAYAEDSGLLFMETSAKTALNVNELFVALANKLPKTLPIAAASIVTVGKPSEESRGGCCS